MNDSANDRQVFERLMAQCLGDGLTADQNDQLDRILERNPEYASEYVAQMNLDVMLDIELNQSESDSFLESLVSEAESQIQVSAATASATLRSWTITQSFPILASTIAILVMVGAGMMWWSTSERNEDLFSAPKPVAVLLDSEDAVWTNHPQGIAYGTKFHTGEVITLKSGIVRIGFDSGAGVVLEGPAELKIQSKLAAQLRLGRLSAVVPEEARGFRVDTSEIRIIDYGTRFGAVVGADGGAEVHVFEGEVGVESASRTISGQTRLYANQARRFNAPDVAVIPTEPENFAETPTLEQLVIGRSGTYPPRSQQFPLPHATDSQPDTELHPHDDPLPQSILIGESFADDTRHWPEQSGGVGFGESVWETDEIYTRLIAPEERLTRGDIDGGRRAVLLHGRDRARPSIANRIVRRLGKPIDSDVYFSFLGRYSGLDDDDFFVLWFDNNNSPDASHSLTPNVGILRNDFIARFRVYPIDNNFVAINHTSLVHQSAPVNDETFFLVAKLFKQDSDHFDRLALWINPDGGEERQPNLVATFDAESNPISSFQHIGVRIGQNSEVSDELLLDRLVIADTYAKVTRPCLPNGTRNED